MNRLFPGVALMSVLALASAQDTAPDQDGAVTAGPDLRQIASQLEPEKVSFGAFRNTFGFTESSKFGIVHIDREGDIITYYLGNNERMEAYAKAMGGRSAVLGSGGFFAATAEEGIWAGRSSMSSDDGHVVECALRFRVSDRVLQENTCAQAEVGEGSPEE